MTKTMLIRFSAFFILITLLSACSAEKKFHRRLTGSWDIVRYDQRFANGENQVLSDLGTITFNKNGSGNNDIPVLTRSLNKSENSDFSWKNTIDEVTIISRNTYLAKSWIVVKNKKSQQIWKSTTQANVQTMELQKVK
jgi:hypothetical protein